MSLVKFKKRPWFPTEFSNFFGDDDFFNERFWNRYVQSEPMINVKETEGEYQVELAAPGLEKDDFEISIDDGYLIIKAEKTVEKEDVSSQLRCCDRRKGGLDRHATHGNRIREHTGRGIVRANHVAHEGNLAITPSGVH